MRSYGESDVSTDDDIPRNLGSNEEEAGHPGPYGEPDSESQESPPGRESFWACCRALTPTGMAVVLSAMALGALGVWLFLRATHSPQERASHRIEALRQRLDELAQELARYAEQERESTQRAGKQEPTNEG